MLARNLDFFIVHIKEYKQNEESHIHITSYLNS